MFMGFYRVQGFKQFIYLGFIRVFLGIRAIRVGRNKDPELQILRTFFVTAHARPSHA